MWDQRRERTGANVYPVWRALAMLVPICGWFRFHARIRQYQELRVERGAPDTLNPGLLTTVVVISLLVGSPQE
jgi:hypothetical protein